MEAHDFALIVLFGVPFAMIGLTMLVYCFIPKHLWHTLPVQTFGTIAFLGALAAPFALMVIDGEGDYFEDRRELVTNAFALPAGVGINKQRDRTIRLGDCWRNAVNWRSDVHFPSDAAFDEWYAREGWREALVAQIAGYFGVKPEAITIGEGALDMGEHDPRYQLVDDHKAYSQNVRILEFYEPFVCTAIEKDAQGSLSLRRCDPVALTEDSGNAGRVIINPSLKDRTLEGRIYYAQGPSTCTNPVRRAVNDAFGWPHPDGKPNTSMGAILPGD